MQSFVEEHHNATAWRDGVAYAVPTGLFLLFFLVPSVSLHVFSTFAWYAHQI